MVRTIFSYGETHVIELEIDNMSEIENQSIFTTALTVANLLGSSKAGNIPNDKYGRYQDLQPRSTRAHAPSCAFCRSKRNQLQSPVLHEVPCE